MVSGLVSVIMSNFNTSELYLRLAIESVLSQTYDNFELIIVDDCSTDNSISIISSYSDERIVVLKNDNNLGITKSLNKALSIARGEFIARMDSDDICLPNRFEKQVQFLSDNKSVIVCGSAVEFVGDIKNKKDIIQYRKLPEREIFQINLLFANNPNIVHPSAMFNNNLLKKYNIIYNENYKYAQDYRMWVECSKYADCVNLPDVLLKYRLHTSAVSAEKKEEQRNCMLNILKEQLLAIGITANTEQLELHENLLFSRQKYSIEYKKWIKYLILQNSIYRCYDIKKLKRILWYKWCEITYFGLVSDCRITEKFKMILDLPIHYWFELIKIFYIRKTKNRG